MSQFTHHGECGVGGSILMILLPVLEKPDAVVSINGGDLNIDFKML